MARFFRDGLGTADPGVYTEFIGERQFYASGQRMRDELYQHERADLTVEQWERGVPRVWIETVRFDMEPARADEPQGVT